MHVLVETDKEKKRPDKLDIKTKDEFLGWNEKTALEASWIKLYQC